MKKLLLIFSIICLTLHTKGQNNYLKAFDTVIKSNHDSVRTKYDFLVHTAYYSFGGDSVVGFRGKCIETSGTTIKKTDFNIPLKWNKIGVSVNSNTLNVNWDRSLVKQQLKPYFILMITDLQTNTDSKNK